RRQIGNYGNQQSSANPPTAVVPTQFNVVSAAPRIYRRSEIARCGGRTVLDIEFLPFIRPRLKNSSFSGPIFESHLIIGIGNSTGSRPSHTVTFHSVSGRGKFVKAPTGQIGGIAR